MKKELLKTVTTRILPHLSNEWVLREPIIFHSPISHILKVLVIGIPRATESRFGIGAYCVPLFVPDYYDCYAIGLALTCPYDRKEAEIELRSIFGDQSMTTLASEQKNKNTQHWLADSNSLHENIELALSQQAFPLWQELGTPDGLAGNVHRILAASAPFGGSESNLQIAEAVAYSYILASQLDLAIQECSKIISKVENKVLVGQGVYSKSIKRIQLIYELLKKQPTKAQQQLRDWEDISFRTLKLSKWRKQ